MTRSADNQRDNARTYRKSDVSQQIDFASDVESDESADSLTKSRRHLDQPRKSSTELLANLEEWLSEHNEALAGSLAHDPDLAFAELDDRLVDLNRPHRDSDITHDRPDAQPDDRDSRAAMEAIWQEYAVNPNRLHAVSYSNAEGFRDHDRLTNQMPAGIRASSDAGGMIELIAGGGDAFALGSAAYGTFHGSTHRDIRLDPEVGMIRAFELAGAPSPSQDSSDSESTVADGKSEVAPAESLSDRES